MKRILSFFLCIFLISCSYKVYTKDHIIDEDGYICECEYIIVRNDLKSSIRYKGLCCELEIR